MPRYAAATISQRDKVSVFEAITSGILTQFVQLGRHWCKSPTFRALRDAPVQRRLLLRRTQRDHGPPKDAIGIGAHAAVVTTSAG
jgi:hypothetical protein